MAENAVRLRTCQRCGLSVEVSYSPSRLKWCPDCRKAIKAEADARYKEANREKLRLKALEYQAANREKIRTRSAQRYRAHPEGQKERATVYYQQHRETVLEAQRRKRVESPEKVREARRRWRADNNEREREKARQLRKANPAAHRAAAKVRRARKRNAPNVEVVHLDVVFKRDGHRCHICKRKVARKDASMDHLVPLSRGGDHTYANVALAHLLCNSSRGARGPAQLRMLGEV